MSDSNSAKLKGLLMLASANTPAPEAQPELIPWRPEFGGIPPPGVHVLAPLDPSLETVPDSIGYHSRQMSGVPWVRHAPLPVSALAPHGAVAASSSQTLAARAVASALPGIIRQNGPVTALATAINSATQDNVPDGFSFGRVQNTELSGNTVKQLNDGVNVRNAASAAAAHDAVGNLLFKNLLSATPTTSGPSTTSSAFSVLAEMSITANFKGNKVLIQFSANFDFATVSGSCFGQFALFKDGVQLSTTYEFGFSQTATYSQESVCQVAFLDTPSSGSHTYTVQWASKNGFTLINLGTARTFQVVELG